MGAEVGSVRLALAFVSLLDDDKLNRHGHRPGLVRLRQLPAAASSTSLLSRTDTRLSTATDDTSDVSCAPSAPHQHDVAVRAIPIRPPLDRRRSSTGDVSGVPSPAGHGRLGLSSSLPARPRKPSSFASATAAPFSNLVALPPDRAPDERAGDDGLVSTAQPEGAPRPLRSVSTTIVHGHQPKVLKRKASVTTRGRYGGDVVVPSGIASRTPRRPTTASSAGESTFPPSFTRPLPLDAAYPAYSAAAYLPLSPAPVFATAPLDLAASASSSTEALPRAPSGSRPSHTRGRSQGRPRSKSKPKPRTESVSAASAASASETDSAGAASVGAASTSKTGTIRSGLLKLRKSTASLRNAFRPSRLDLGPPPPLPSASTTSSASSSSASFAPALPLSPVRAAATQPSLVSSVAGAAVDHAALAFATGREQEPLSPTTPRASRRSGERLGDVVAAAAENVPPVPPLPGCGQDVAGRSTRTRSRPRRPATATVVPQAPPSVPAASASTPREGGMTSLRRAMSTSVLRGGGEWRADPPRGELVRRVEEWARESGR